jgi:hypothetical protein
MKMLSMSRLLCAALLIISLRALGHEDEPIPSGAPDRLGDVVFPISCNAAAQAEFNRALAMLHSFFYPEAAKTFSRAAEIDPSCAMGHWGVAMSLWYPLWFPPNKESFQQGKAALDKAIALGAPTQRERDYIAALANFYADFDRLDHKSRSLAYEQAMAQVQQKYPEDREAAAFYALALQSTANPNDKTYANQLKSAAILEKLFAEQPNHPGVAHYLIHAYDYPELAARALPAARRYGAIAPTMPHALHMPSHTYIALGLWQESIESNLAAGAAARKLGWAQEELHAMDYLVYAYLQGARSEAANEVLRKIAEVNLAESARTLVFDYAKAAAPARFALEQQRWEEAAALAPFASRFPGTTALTYFARALGAAHLSRIDSAEAEVAQLTQLRDTLLKSKQDYWAKQVDIQRETALAWVSWAKGNGTQAIELMRGAVALEESTYKHPAAPGWLLPARELLGDLLMALRLPDRALIEYEASLRTNPKRFNGLYGAAQSAEATGVAGKAAAHYRELLDISKGADGERDELRRATLFLTLSRDR